MSAGKTLATLLLSILIVPYIPADEMRIAVSIRYLQNKGTSHAHIYLYSGDGKLIRQITKDDLGQDVEPIIAPNGREIVFTRNLKIGHQLWQVQTPGANAHRIDEPPSWYADAKKSTPRFTALSLEWERWYKNLPSGETQATPQPSPVSTPRPLRLVSPDSSVELILDRTGDDAKDYDDQQLGRLYRFRDLKTGDESLIGGWPGFETIWDPLHLRGHEESYFLFEPPLRTIFFFRHLNSTDGDTVYALDLNGRRVVRLSPNYATPIPIAADPSFFTITYERYLPLGDGKRTVNCSYLDRWDVEFHRTRFAQSAPAIFCGASVTRTNHPSLVIESDLH